MDGDAGALRLEQGSPPGGSSLEVRELAEKLNRHHEAMEREFTNSNQLAGTVVQALRDEADELKRLLAVGGGGGGGGGATTAGGGSKADLVLLARLRSDAMERDEAEAKASSVEEGLRGNLVGLEELLKGGGPREFAARLAEEINAAPARGSGELAHHHHHSESLADLQEKLAEVSRTISLVLSPSLTASLRRSTLSVKTLPFLPSVEPPPASLLAVSALAVPLPRPIPRLRVPLLLLVGSSPAGGGGPRESRSGPRGRADRAD